MKFDRLMDFVTYVFIAMIVISLVCAAVSIMFELRNISEEMEFIDYFEEVNCGL